MHYIRFLKLPKYDRGDVKIKTTITITTDLGETFLDEDVELDAALVCVRDGRRVTGKLITWTNGMRSVAVELELDPRSTGWPVLCHIRALRSRSGWALPAVFPVRSAEIMPDRGAGSRVLRTLACAGGGVDIYEDTGDSIARHLWDGSLVLSASLDEMLGRRQDPMPLLLSIQQACSKSLKCNIVELGCGCGIVGLALKALLPEAEVILTDLPEVEELVELNISRGVHENVTFVPWDWENDIPDRVTDLGRIDLVVAAECIYNTDSIPALVDTLVRLVDANPNALILLSRKVRHDSEVLFFELCKGKNLLQRDHRSVPLPGRPGHGYGDSAETIDIYLLSGPDHAVQRVCH